MQGFFRARRSDADENGVELYRDRPEAEWPRPQDGARGVAMFSAPLDLRALLAEAASA